MLSVGSTPSKFADTLSIAFSAQSSIYILKPLFSCPELALAPLYSLHCRGHDGKYYL